MTYCEIISSFVVKTTFFDVASRGILVVVERCTWTIELIFFFKFPRISTLVFYRLLTEKYLQCLHTRYRCFIIDKNGFFVIHKHFVDFNILSDLKDLSNRIGSIHITELEKSVAEDMIRSNVLRRKQCKQYKEINTRNFYEVHLSGTLSKTTSRCPHYQITQLTGTNAYLGRLTFHSLR